MQLSKDQVRKIVVEQFDLDSDDFPVNFEELGFYLGDVTPVYESYTCSIGDRYMTKGYVVVCKDGALIVFRKLEFETHYCSGRNHEPDEHHEAKSVAEQIAKLNLEPLFLINYFREYKDYNDPIVNERRVIVYVLQSMDVGKIKRRVRDALNKTATRTKVVNCAMELGVKLF